MVLDRIKIVDLNRGTASVTNDIENVLRKIEAWHQGSIAGYRIMYRDADGYFDGVEWDGEHARFFAIRETDEATAEKRLLARNTTEARLIWMTLPSLQSLLCSFTPPTLSQEPGASSGAVAGLLRCTQRGGLREEKSLE
jgi:hypothetical protein